MRSVSFVYQVPTQPMKKLITKGKLQKRFAKVYALLVLRFMNKLYRTRLLSYQGEALNALTALESQFEIYFFV